MTFRDDHEAALRRAEALDRELDSTKQQRDRLQAEVEEMRRRAVAEPEADNAARASRRVFQPRDLKVTGIVVGVIASFFVLLALSPTVFGTALAIALAAGIPVWAMGTFIRDVIREKRGRR